MLLHHIISVLLKHLEFRVVTSSLLMYLNFLLLHLRHTYWRLMILTPSTSRRLMIQELQTSKMMMTTIPHIGALTIVVKVLKGYIILVIEFGYHFSKPIIPSCLGFLVFGPKWPLKPWSPKYRYVKDHICRFISKMGLLKEIGNIVSIHLTGGGGGVVFVFIVF